MTRDFSDEKDFSRYTAAFEDLPILKGHVVSVLAKLPDDVFEDFASDPTFDVVLENFVPGEGSKMFMSLPAESHQVSRCVVLRKKLEHAPEDFTLWLIAHELAHAFLRNGGWREITDKEEAADALAASWGYAKPKMRWF